MTVGKVKDFNFSHKGGMSRGPVKKFEDGGMAGEPMEIGSPRSQPQAPQLTPQQRRQLEMQQAAKRRMMIAQQAQGQGAMSDADMRQMGNMQQAYPGQQYKKGGKVHDDAAQDKKMIKSMIKPSALKKAAGGQAVQMAKSNAVEASMEGQKKTGYAGGGKAKGKSNPILKAPDMGPLSSLGGSKPPMPAPAKSVPVDSGAPVIPQRPSTDIGVGKSRTGKPNVGAIRAAMAKKATMAAPEAAPAMMKKGGKVGC